MLELDSGDTPEKLKEEYLDIYDGIQSELLSTTGFDENSDLSMTYLGRVDSTRTSKIKVGGVVSVLFIIPIIVDIHVHRPEVYTLVSEIHVNADLVLGIKNIFELEEVINSQDFCFRSIPIFPEECLVLKTKEQRLIKIEAPFIDEISGLAIIKVLDKNTQSTMTLKLKFIWNSAMLDITNTCMFGFSLKENQILCLETSFCLAPSQAFSSLRNLRKLGLVPGESLSLSTKFDSLLDKNQTYIMSNRMRSLHMHLTNTCLDTIIFDPEEVLEC